jgi:hypothetical protein
LHQSTEAALRFVRHSIGAAIVLAVASTSIPLPAHAQLASLNFKGFNYVSYYNGGYVNADSMPALVTTGANAVALAFEYGIDVDNSTVYADSGYTDSSSVIASTIAEANSHGLNVMVRPLIDFLDQSKIGTYSVGDWRSTYNPTNAATFFASYKSMIVSVAQLAQANGATSLSIGVELDQLTGPTYQSYWTDIITAVRAVFSGKLTYSSEWDDNQSPWQGLHGLPAGTGDLTTQVSFWSQLDYLGIDAYPPISGAASPTFSQLVAGWTQTPTVTSTHSTTGTQSLISYFASVATATGLPLIFTELGYESATDAASQPFGTSTDTYDPSLQSNLYAAFFEAWRQSGSNTLTGVYFWNWDPNAGEVGPGHGPNFSPQGEPAQAVVTANFGGSTPALQVSPASDIAATGAQGGPFTPSSLAFQFQATSGSVAYAVSGMPSWLTASSTSGTVTTTGTAVTLSTNANANTLSPGSYSATITFTDTTNSDIILALSAVLSVSQTTTTLSMSVTGDGTVTSSPWGISCGSTCSASFAAGTQVSLNATPAAGWSFTGWGGACSGAGICQVTMSTVESVTATFVQAYTLSVAVSGNATVTSTPSGINCGSTCGSSFNSGTAVTLNETPGSGGAFSGWSGACSGTESCIVTVNAAESVTASFLLAQGGLTRTFVSSSGVDGNPCTVMAPCATFAHAYTLTQPDGIIAALDPGKYGPLTITYPVTVNGNGFAAITGTAQGNGITINAGSGNVVLTGLEVDGAGAAFNGIVFNSGGSLTIDNCTVKDFIQGGSGGPGTSGNGVWIAPTAGAINFTIVNTIAVDNAYAGIFYGQPSGSAAASGVIDRVVATNNPGNGIDVAMLGGSGGSAAVTISNSVANNNGGAGIVASGSSYIVTLDHDEVSNNATGVAIGANTSVLLSRSVITKNTNYGVSNSGTAGSSTDNRIYRNGADLQGNPLTDVQPQ